MVGLGQPVLDPVRLADHVEHCACAATSRCIGVARLLGELDAVVGQNCVDFVGNGLEQGDEERTGRFPASLPDQLSDGELAGAVDGDEQVELAFGGLHLGDVDMEEADRVALELLLVGLVALDSGKPRDAMPLQAAMQR